MSKQKKGLAKKQIWSAQKAFEQGDLKSILQRVAPPGKTDEEKVVLIGAMAFLGRWVEAESLANTIFSHISARHQARVGFYLAVAFTRASDFKSARKWLKAIIQAPKVSAYAESAQAMAFYFFFCGNFIRAHQWGRKALQKALSAGDSFIHLAALDLLAHAEVQMGKRFSGVRLFEETALKAKQNSFSTIEMSARLAKLRYEAEAGLRPHSILEELNQALNNLPAVDTYSRAGLVMEISRQLTLRGRWGQARDLLSGEAAQIYSFQDRRQEMTLLLRMGEISFRQGDFAGALHFVRSAHRCLNRIADKQYEARVLGLEKKVYTFLGNQEFPQKSIARLDQLYHELPSKINSQIMSRLSGDFQTSTPEEDPMHDLFLKLKNDSQQGLSDLIQLGYLGLWPLAYGLPPGQESLIIDKKAHLISINNDGVYRSTESLSSRPLKILLRLAQGPCSKQDLIEGIWGYEYDPLRHDSLVYAGLASLRTFLGPVSIWLENFESFWIIKRGVKVIQDKKIVQASTVDFSNLNNFDDSFRHHSEFSYRQLGALKMLNARDYWDMKTYKKVFSVSTMTAWRDLSAFTKTGFLVKYGRGPATKYVPQKKVEI